MEIKISSNQILKVLYIVSWVIFVGLCIEAGGFLFNAFFTVFISADGAKNFWQGNDLSGLYSFDKGYFITEVLLMSIVAVMQALLFYLIVKVLHDKKLNMKHPFNKDVGRFLFNGSYLTLGIGFFSYWGVKHTEWFVKQGVVMPSIESLRLGGADVWLFMSITLFVIAQIFKRGIEIQNENDLTI